MTRNRIAGILSFWLMSLMSMGQNGFDKEPVSYLDYIQNKGQWNDKVLYRADFRGGALFLENSSFTYLFYQAEGFHQLHGPSQAKQDYHPEKPLSFHAVNMAFDNAQPAHGIVTGKVQPYYQNYFTGSDRRHWASQVQACREVLYQGLYQGIDLRIVGSGNNPRYDFIVAPGAHPSDIKLKFTGQDRLALREGRLIISTSVGNIEQQAPVAYQEDLNGRTRKVACHYTLSGNSVGISITGPYDQSLPLVIDPTLVFATYTGSTADNWGMTATYDGSSNGYTAGICFHPGYPVTPGAFQTTFAGPGSMSNPGFDISVSKFDASGSSLMFSTYLGGSADESPQSIIVDYNNNLIVLGRTYSADFPVTTGAYDVTLGGGSDIIVTKFNPTGTALVASTFVGGLANDGINITDVETTLASIKSNYADDGRGSVLVDKSNNIYVASSTLSSDFPVTGNAFQPALKGLQDGCIFKMDPMLSSMLFSSFLGGTNNDAAYNIALNSHGELYITGGTESPDFPATPGTLHTSYMGSIDGYVTHLSASGNAILQSTYIGTASYDQSYFVQTDKFDNVYIYGQCSGNYPISPGVYADANSGQFIHEMNPTLSSTIFSTEFGAGRGTPDIVPSAFLVDNCQNIYISGWGGTLFGFNNASSSTVGLTNTTNAFQTNTDGQDFYFLVLAKNAASLLYASYFGGQLSSEHVDGGTSRFDKTGVIYQAICESCGGHSDMPTTPNAWSSTNNAANCNNALVKFRFDILQTVAQLNTNPMVTTGCVPFTVSFINNSVHAVTYRWDFGDGSTSTAVAPAHTYTATGTFTVMLIATDSSTCNMVDTTYTSITVHSAMTLAQITPTMMCKGDSVQLSVNASQASGYSWSPTASLSNGSIYNPIASPSVTTVYSVTVSDSLCNTSDVATVQVTVNQNNTHILQDPAHLCIDDTVKLAANASYSSYAWSTGQSSAGISVTHPGLYTLTTIDLNGCKGIDSMRVDSFVHVPITPYDTVICKGQDVQLSAPAGNYQYQWNPPGSLSSSNSSNPVASPASNTVYTVSVANGPCITHGTFTVLVHPLPNLAVASGSVLILPGESVELHATSDTTCYWYPGHDLSCTTCFSPIASPEENTIYYVSAVNQFGCVNTSSVIVNIMPTFYVPNTFTPTGDGLNDVFRPVFTGYTDLDVYIFNRWGEQIYHYNTLDGGWDGTYKGAKAELGVYVYKIYAKDYLNKEIERVGSITLLR